MNLKWVSCLLLLVGVLIHDARCRSSNSKKKMKKPHDDVKKVSSDRVKNGGNKGPMSGLGNIPNPLQIPLPLIPKKNKNKLRNKSQKKRPGRPVDSVKNKHGTGKKSGPNKDSDVTTTTTGNSNLDKRSVVGVEEMFVPLEHEEVVERMRRHTNDDEFSDDERKLRDEWLSFDAHDNIPSTEAASFMPSDLNFILEGKNSLVDAYDTIIPRVKERLQKRSVLDDDEDVDVKHSFVQQVQHHPEEDLMSFNKVMEDGDTARVEQKRDLTDYDLTTEEEEAVDDYYPESDTPRNMKVREISPDDDFYEGAIEIVDDREDADFVDPIHHHISTRETLPKDEPFMTVTQAEQQLRDAELAAKALSSLEVKLGVDPENIIPTTHKYVDQLQAEKSRYDEDIRKHILNTHDVEKLDVKDDEVEKQKMKRTEIEDAKQVLANDRNKIEEITTELKELKDIELMATGLEVAKFLAHERAETSLRAARSHIQTAGHSSSLAETNLGSSSPVPSAMVQTVMSSPMATSVTFQPELPQPEQEMLVPHAQPVQLYPSPVNMPSIDNGIHEIAAQRHITRPTIMKAPPPSIYNAPLQSYETHRQFYGQSPAYNKYPMPEQVSAGGYQMFKAPMENQPPMPTLHSLLGAEQGAHSLFTAEPPVNFFRPSSNQRQVSNQFFPSQQQQQQSQLKVLAPPPAKFSPFHLYHPPPVFFHAQPFSFSPILQQRFQQHAVGEQRHFTSKPQMPPFYPVFRKQPFVINSFASTSSKQPQRQNTGQMQKNTDNEKDDNTGETDWLSSMSFPGTTYSPPPSWLRPPQAQSIRQHKLYKQPSLAVTKQPMSIPQYPPSSVSLPDEFHPAITEISSGSALTMEHQQPGVAPFSTLRPYKLETPVMSQNNNLQPAVSQFINTPATAPANIPVQPFAINNNNPEQSIMQQLTGGAQSIVSSFASPQNSPSGASQVILMGPTNSVVTINEKPKEPQKSSRPGPLPGYIGAVEMAKYPEDMTDRLRNNNNNSSKSSDNNKTPKRQELVRAENNLGDVKRASIAVTNVENAVGFDPGSIVKMIDFVKTAAEKDVQLSKDIIDKDKEMIRQIESEEQSKIATAQKSELDKRSDIKSVAYEHAQEKLKSDQALLLDAEDRLDKIEKMELVLTEIEVAKYIASDRAEKDVEGAKRTIDVSAEITRASRSPQQKEDASSH